MGILPPLGPKGVQSGYFWSKSGYFRVPEPKIGQIPIKSLWETSTPVGFCMVHAGRDVVSWPTLLRALLNKLVFSCKLPPPAK